MLMSRHAQQRRPFLTEVLGYPRIHRWRCFAISIQCQLYSRSGDVGSFYRRRYQIDAFDGILAALTTPSPLQRIAPSNAMALSSFLSAILVLLLWGTAGLLASTGTQTASLSLLFPFAIGFGLVGGGFTSMWVQSASRVAGSDKEAQGLLFSGR
jgi:hypothetical protein